MGRGCKFKTQPVKRLVELQQFLIRVNNPTAELPICYLFPSFVEDLPSPWLGWNYRTVVGGRPGGNLATRDISGQGSKLNQ